MKNVNDKRCRLIIELFQEIPDPKVDRTKVHSLAVILFIALCTFLVGGQSFYEMETFAKSRREWLSRVAGMVSPPSHDTFNRVFQALCPEAFGDFLIKVAHTLRANLSQDIVAIDWQTGDIDWFADKNLWKGLKSFCMVEATREINGKVETNRRYYISSLALDVEKAAKAIRTHWQVENCLHWRLDVVFQEDASRARTRNAAKNLGTLRALCMNLIKKIPGKASLKCKRLQAAPSDEALLTALRV